MPNPITFSTLACPEWPIETVIAKAAEFGYNGLEWRGGAQGHVQPSMPSSHKAALRRLSADAGLFALAVTAYTSFVSEDPNERQANVDELRRYADLAAELGARYVRAFVGELPPSVDPARMHGRIAECLEAAAEHARHNGVMIALEPHDHFVRSAAVHDSVSVSIVPSLSSRITPTRTVPIMNSVVSKNPGICVGIGPPAPSPHAPGSCGGDMGWLGPGAAAANMATAPSRNAHTVNGFRTTTTPVRIVSPPRSPPPPPDGYRCHRSGWWVSRETPAAPHRRRC